MLNFFSYISFCWSLRPFSSARHHCRRLKLAFRKDYSGLWGECIRTRYPRCLVFSAWVKKSRSQDNETCGTPKKASVRLGIRWLAAQIWKVTVSQVFFWQTRCWPVFKSSLGTIWQGKEGNNKKHQNEDGRKPFLPAISRSTGSGVDLSEENLETKDSLKRHFPENACEMHRLPQVR